MRQNDLDSPVNGEKTKGDTIWAIEHMPEMQPWALP
jgi:hypothetical protein